MIYTEKIEIEPIVYFNSIQLNYVLISISYAGTPEVDQRYKINKFLSLFQIIG